MYKDAASGLNIPWPVVATKTPRSCYDGKKLSKATRTAKQLPSVFPELLDEAAVSPKGRSFRGKT